LRIAAGEAAAQSCVGEKLGGKVSCGGGFVFILGEEVSRGFAHEGLERRHIFEERFFEGRSSQVGSRNGHRQGGKLNRFTFSAFFPDIFFRLGRERDVRDKANEQYTRDRR